MYIHNHYLIISSRRLSCYSSTSPQGLWPYYIVFTNNINYAISWFTIFFNVFSNNRVRCTKLYRLIQRKKINYWYMGCWKITSTKYLLEIIRLQVKIIEALKNKCCFKCSDTVGKYRNITWRWLWKEIKKFIIYSSHINKTYNSRWNSSLLINIQQRKQFINIGHWRWTSYLGMQILQFRWGEIIWGKDS